MACRLLYVIYLIIAISGQATSPDLTKKIEDADRIYIIGLGEVKVGLKKESKK